MRLNMNSKMILILVLTLLVGGVIGYFVGNKEGFSAQLPLQDEIDSIIQPLNPQSQQFRPAEIQSLEQIKNQCIELIQNSNGKNKLMDSGYAALK